MFKKSLYGGLKVIHRTQSVWSALVVKQYLIWAGYFTRELRNVLVCHPTPKVLRTHTAPVLTPSPERFAELKWVDVKTGPHGKQSCPRDYHAEER